MAQTKEIITKIYLNDEQAQDKLSKLEQRLSDIRDKRDKAFQAQNFEALKDYNDELRKTQKEMDNIKVSGQTINRTLQNLSTASVKDLKRTMIAINAELKSGRVVRNSEEWKVLNGQLKKCREEMQKIRNESKAVTQNDSFVHKTADFLNRNWGAITQTITGFTSVVIMIRSVINKFAEMEQTMADVRKYTGQTTEEVEHMNEVFKQLDTRTGREELNQLAGAAGRLGITAEKDILQFVDAADKINVALGDDLGKGAVDQVGKLSMAFGEDDRMGLRGAMLATGSAINELAQNSSAQAGYLVDFTARLAGVGVQAKMSQAQIMGWGSVLDENMQKEEMAATALSNIIATMATDSSKMAKVAGLDVKAFADLIKTDMNAALMQFFDAMNSKGGFTALAPMFADMGLDGARATAVLAVLASKIDDVRKNQLLANAAYEQGTSVIDEFNVQNTTVQAGLDKAKKKFQDLCIELGERLEPIGKYTISTASLGIKVLNELVKFTAEYWKSLTALAVTITAITAIYYAQSIAVAANTAATKIHTTVVAAWNVMGKIQIALLGTWKVAVALLTGNIQKATVALQAMRIAGLANPYTAIAIALSSVIIALAAATKAFAKQREELQRLKDEYDAVRKANKDWAEIQHEAAKQNAEEKARIEKLTDVIHSNSYSVKERREAIMALQAIVPQYHASISKEGNLYKENTNAIANYIKQLEAAALAQAYLNKVTKLKEAEADIRVDLMKNKEKRAGIETDMQKRGIKKTEQVNIYAGGGPGGVTMVQAEQHTREYKALLEQDKAIDSINQKLETNRKEQELLYKMMKNAEKDNPLITAAIVGNKKAEDRTAAVSSAAQSTGYVSEKAQKKQEQERKKQEAALKRELAKEKSAYRAEIKSSKDLEQKNINEILAAYAQGAIRYSEYEAQMTQAKADGVESRLQIMQKYGFGETEEYEKLQAEKLRILEDGEKQLEDYKNKVNIRKIELEQSYAEEELRVRYNTVGDDIYQDEIALNEALFQNDLEFLRKKQALYKASSEEFHKIAEQMEELELNHQLQTQQLYYDRFLQYRDLYGQQDISLQRQQAEKELAVIAEELMEQGKLTEDEYRKMLQSLRSYYAEKELIDAQNGTSQAQTSAKADTAYKMAKADAIKQNDKGKPVGIGSYITDSIKLYKTTTENLKEMFKSTEISYEEMCEAIGHAGGDLATDLAEKLQAAMSSVSSIMNGMSSYYSAAADYEVNVTTKKYDKLIDAAGNNTKKTKRLEEQKEKEIAKIKTKYAKKQAAMQMAQAVAQTAVNALNAYGSVWSSNIPYPVAAVLAPVAAGIAMAAGMVQVAAIKKQQQAQQAGYYEGGFTGGKRYRQEAGVVHEGEFVANHKAVENQNILPFLQFLDTAQRNNTVGSLTKEDVSRQLGGSSAAVVAPVVNVTTDNAELRQTMTVMNSVIVRLNGILENGIEAPVYIDGNNGVAKQLSRYNKMKSLK